MMSIDISKLSAKELYELARQKEIEEQRQAELNEHLNKLKVQREQLLAKFQQTISGIDSEIKQLQQKRERLVSDHDLDMGRLESEIDGTRQQGEQALAPPPPSPRPAASPPATNSKPVSPPASDPDELYNKIAELMRTREYISDSLLREKLKSLGFHSPNLGKELEQLVKEKRLVSKSGGSYVLGKK